MKIEVFSNPEQIVIKDFEVHHLTFDQRLKASAKMGSFFVLAALFAALIPVVHLILVPLFLLFSLLSGIWKLRQKIRISAPDLRCPGCQAAQFLATDLVAWPYRGYCAECRSQFILRPQV